MKVEVERQFDNAFPERTIAEVIIHTTDGRKLSSEPVEALWEATDIRPTDADLEDKFMRLVGPVLGHKEAKKIAAMIWELEKMPAIEELIKACVRG